MLPGSFWTWGAETGHPRFALSSAGTGRAGRAARGRAWGERYIAAGELAQDVIGLIRRDTEWSSISANHGSGGCGLWQLAPPPRPVGTVASSFSGRIW